MCDARPSLDLSSRPGISGLWVVCVVGRDFVPLQKSLLVGAERGLLDAGSRHWGDIFSARLSVPGCP